MNTAMQELINKLTAMVENGGDPDLLPAIEHAKALLFTEKEQLIKACETGLSHGWLASLDPTNRDKGEKFYYQTYQNKIKK